MSYADLSGHFWLIVLAVVLLCVGGVALGLWLSQRTRFRISWAFQSAAEILSLLIVAATGYRILVGERRLGEWGLVVWIGLTSLAAILAVGRFLKTLSNHSTGRGTRA